MANYGDVALGLRADWTRNNYENQEWVLSTVGHEDGEADVFLTDEPDTQFQFLWADVMARPGHASDAQLAAMRGFEFVKQTEFTKRKLLWQWDAEGFLIHAGQKLMYRSKERWLVDQKRRSDIQAKTSADSSDRDLDNAPDGLVAMTADGKQVKRKKRGI